MKRYSRCARIFILCWLFVTLSVSAGFSGTPSPTGHRWLDVDGRPLPFQEDAELLEFLRTARMVSERKIGTGVNESYQILLEKNGVRAHAIFREVDRREATARIQGTTYRFFADSYLFEPAAYELAGMLELDNIPPAVVRRIGRREGSVQIWLEDTIDEEGNVFRPPVVSAWVEQVWEMNFFDNLVYNIDRNSGNLLVSPDYRLWMIDHTRAFQFKEGLLDDKITRMRRRTWERLQALSEEALRARLSRYLTSRELAKLWKRRERIIDHINGLLAERGEASVLFE